MARPLRIEYNDAFYHVMNRGRGRQQIFNSPSYYQAFLETLAEAHIRFNTRIHAYCLMRNHYHLLIETPEGNLNRIMRHINGVYTQRHNRLKRTDGPLFRGRYKAILIDSDQYLLPLSRYIHRNPIETKKPSVKPLSRYPWSSYPSYIDEQEPLDWLYRELIYDVLGEARKYTGYRTYIEQGVEKELQAFYGKGKIAAVLGDKAFRARALKKNRVPMADESRANIKGRPTFTQIIEAVAQVFGKEKSHLVLSPKGRRQRNIARKVAMYLCQQQGGMSLNRIASDFSVNHVGSVSNALNDVKQLLEEDRHVHTMVHKVLYMIQ